jgi:alpha-beta hydrolase superfamily lysophospholipase
LITGWFSSPNKKEQPDDYPPLPSDFTSVFMNVVDLLKQDAVLVECPVMILHGTEDETITVSSSRKIYKKIPAAQKGLILLEGVGHAILDDPAYASMALHTIAAFIDGQIHF